LNELGFGDIRPAHGFMFKCITPDGATGIELAEHLGITKQAVSKMVDYLEKSGYVMRRTHPTDKRGQLIVLTERGLSISHTTIMRLVHQYGPELDKRIRCHLKKANDSWWVDETK
jgi:DNA-binding MarR family transcriptional regulator